MITRGCYIFTLLVGYVLSIPVPSDQAEKDDIKVMKCIVEVIADSLNKPHPIAVSQECQEALTGDERIVSILRHQNLLKELQELAAQGVSERVHQPPQKKNEQDSDQVTDALGGHPGMEDTTERAKAREEAAETGDNEVEVEEEGPGKSGESREGNDIGGTNEGETAEKAEEGEAKEKDDENHGNGISDSVSRGQGEEEQEENEEKTAPSEEEETHSSSGEDEGKGKEGNETEEDDSTQISKDGDTEQLTAAPETESEEKRSKQEEEEAEEEETEGEPEKKRSEGTDKESEEKTMGGVKEDRESRPVLERWNGRAEESTREPPEPVEEEGRAGAEGGNPMQEKQGSPRLLWYAPHHGEENNQEEERRSPEAQELHMMARGEMEEKREEEGSASHRGEDQEIARLAAIESELESVARRIHELRRG